MKRRQGLGIVDPALLHPRRGTDPSSWYAAARKVAETSQWPGGSITLLRQRRALRRGQDAAPDDLPWLPVGDPR